MSKVTSKFSLKVVGNTSAGMYSVDSAHPSTPCICPQNWIMNSCPLSYYPFLKKPKKVVRKITIFLCLWIFVLCFKKLLFVHPLYTRLLSSIYSDGNDYVTSFMSSVRILSSWVSHGNARNPAATTHLQLETAHRHGRIPQQTPTFVIRFCSTFYAHFTVATFPLQDGLGEFTNSDHMQRGLIWEI